MKKDHLKYPLKWIFIKKSTASLPICGECDRESVPSWCLVLGTPAPDHPFFLTCVPRPPLFPSPISRSFSSLCWLCAFLSLPTVCSCSLLSVSHSELEPCPGKGTSMSTVLYQGLPRSNGRGAAATPSTSGSSLPPVHWALPWGLRMEPISVLSRPTAALRGSRSLLLFPC